MISKFFPDYPGDFLRNIYIYIRVNFHEGIFGVISPFKSQNLLCGYFNLSYLDNFMFNLFYMDYFLKFCLGFILSVL